MKIVSKVLKIKLEKPLTLDFIESYFEQHSYTPVRWAIVEVENDFLVLNAALIQ